MYFCFIVVIIEVNLEKLGLTRGAKKISGLTNKRAKEKSKLLVKVFDTQVEELFLEFLDEMRNMSPTDQVKKRSAVLVISLINRRKKPEGELFDVVEQIVSRLKVESSPSKP